jgi:putative spermidine/putrescine transport system substrate-binding protein
MEKEAAMYRKCGFVLLALLFIMPLVSAQTPFEQRFNQMNWNQVVAEAKGQTIYYYAWGGSDIINGFINGYFKDRLAQKYGVTLKFVPVTDATTYVNKVLDEKQAGKNSGGSVDFVWTNGENFRTMKQGKLLFGPFAAKLPNFKYYNEASTAYDFGFPVEGYESPYGAAQVVMEYNSQYVPNPPKTIQELVAWVKKNPGKFTYPAPPDFTGSVVVRHFFYANAVGIKELMGPLNHTVYDRVAAKTWTMLNDLKPSLWMNGQTFPESIVKCEDLMSNGDIWINFEYGPKNAESRIIKGNYPASIKTAVLDTGTIGNTNFLAISFNSSAKAAAMVACNEILDPEVQYQASLGPDKGGMDWMTPMDLTKVSKDWATKFAALPRHPSTLSMKDLNSHKLPEMMSDWLLQIEKDWQLNVLQK